MFDDGGAYDPLTLVETAPGDYSLLLGDEDLDDHVDRFEDHGASGSGYTWAAVATHLVGTERPDLAGRFGLDPEAGMFCAHSTDLAALQALGGLLRDLCADEDRLEALLASRPDGTFD